MGKCKNEIVDENNRRLYEAVTRGHRYEVIDELNNDQVDLSIHIAGKSLLRHAGERGYKEIARLLLEWGMDPNEVSGKRRHTLLHHASLTCNFGFASVLLENGANASPRSSNRSTPLHGAARMGHEYLVRKLIDFNADVNAQDTNDRTPLLLAISKGHVKLAKILLCANGNPSLADRKGTTPRKVAEGLQLDL